MSTCSYRRTGFVAEHDDIWQTVHKVARQTRQWAMRNRKNTFDDSLSEMCAIASMKLHENLSNVGIPSKIAVTDRNTVGHCFILVGDHVVDVTATQFGHEPIFIKPVTTAKNIKAKGFSVCPWHYSKKLENSEKLLQELHKTGWPEYQMYLTKKG